MPLMNDCKVEIGEKGAGGVAPTTWTVLPSLTDMPDLGDEPESVDTSTLDYPYPTSELGRAGAETLVVPFRYRLAEPDGETPSYKTLAGLVEKISPEKLHTIKFTFKDGMTVSTDVSGVSLKLLGGGINEVRNFEASFSRASGFDVKEGTVPAGKQATK